MKGTKDLYSDSLGKQLSFPIYPNPKFVCAWFDGTKRWAVTWHIQGGTDPVFAMWDIDNPFSPRMRTQPLYSMTPDALGDGTGGNAAAVSGHYFFGAHEDENTIAIIDLNAFGTARSQNPLVTILSLPATPKCIYVDTDFGSLEPSPKALVVGYDGRIEVYDVTTINAPKLLTSTEVSVPTPLYSVTPAFNGSWGNCIIAAGVDDRQNDIVSRFDVTGVYGAYSGLTYFGSVTTGILDQPAPGICVPPYVLIGSMSKQAHMIDCSTMSIVDSDVVYGGLISQESAFQTCPATLGLGSLRILDFSQNGDFQTVRADFGADWVGSNLRQPWIAHYQNQKNQHIVVVVEDDPNDAFLAVYGFDVGRYYDAMETRFPIGSDCECE
jgi:hypothetical protein